MTASGPGTAVTFADLVERARALAAGGRRAVLGIAGAPGAGKSTLVAALLGALADSDQVGHAAQVGHVAHVPMDGFHLADVELDRLGLRDRKGAPATFDAFGYVNLLRRLRADEDEVVYAPSFHRELEQPLAGAIGVYPQHRLILTEGNYLLVPDEPWGRVRGLLDEVWFCAPADEVRVERLVRRHEQFGKTPGAARAWVHGTDEHNARLVAGTRARADLIVPAAVLDELPCA